MNNISSFLLCIGLASFGSIKPMIKATPILSKQYSSYQGVHLTDLWQWASKLDPKELASVAPQVLNGWDLKTELFFKDNGKPRVLYFDDAIGQNGSMTLDGLSTQPGFLYEAVNKLLPEYKKAKGLVDIPDQVSMAGPLAQVGENIIQNQNAGNSNTASGEGHNFSATQSGGSGFYTYMKDNPQAVFIGAIVACALGKIAYDYWKLYNLQKQTQTSSSDVSVPEPAEEPVNQPVDQNVTQNAWLRAKDKVASLSTLQKTLISLAVSTAFGAGAYFGIHKPTVEELTQKHVFENPEEELHIKLSDLALAFEKYGYTTDEDESVVLGLLEHAGLIQQ